MGLDRKGLTAKMLMTPKIEVRIPPAITHRHIGVPRLCWEVASLFRLPKIETPRIIIRMPNVTKPDEGERSGQLWAM